MSTRKRKEIELSIGHAIAVIQNHGDCGCLMCQIAKKTIDELQGTEQMQIAIELQRVKQKT